MPKRYKTAYEEGGLRIQFVEKTTEDGRYCEHEILGKYSPMKGKWNEVFKIRVMDNKKGGLGYIVVLRNINWTTGEPVRQPRGFICHSDSHLLTEVEELNQELLDKLQAQVLACRMKNT